MEKPGIVITGASGRMGQMLARLVLDSDQMRLVGAVDRPGSAWIGRDLGEAMGGQPNGVIVTDDAVSAIARAQAVIDFTTPAATVAFAELAAQARAVHVIGTTGLEEAHHHLIDAAAHSIPVLQTGNMSLGVNLIAALVESASARLGDDWDIEIVEMHHRHKVDAPSGTALLLGEAAARGRGISLADHSERGRDGITGARARGAIGFAALRGGSVAGDHHVIFATDDERIEIGHRAENRAIFARGAVKAALWLVGQGAGRYDMKSVLGL